MNVDHHTIKITWLVTKLEIRLGKRRRVLSYLTIYFIRWFPNKYLKIDGMSQCVTHKHQSSTSQTCHEHIWSPKFVTNIDVTHKMSHSKVKIGFVIGILNLHPFHNMSNVIVEYVDYHCQYHFLISFSWNMIARKPFCLIAFLFVGLASGVGKQCVVIPSKTLSNRIKSISSAASYIIIFIRVRYPLIILYPHWKGVLHFRDK